MEKIVVASSNAHKISEMKQILTNFELLTMSEVGFEGDIEETGTTFKENAEIKADAVYKYLQSKSLNYGVLADDSGLCVNALNGEPGVYSARYCGDHNFELNRRKLLDELNGKNDRSAYFLCAVVYIKPDGTKYFTEGKTFGQIDLVELGDKSFGYDCLFVSDDLHKSFGLCTHEQKNSVSHRFRALQQLNKILCN